MVYIIDDGRSSSVSRALGTAARSTSSGISCPPFCGYSPHSNRSLAGAQHHPPELFEPSRGCGRVPDGVLNVPMSEVILNEPRIRALAGHCEATCGGAICAAAVAEATVAMPHMPMRIWRVIPTVHRAQTAAPVERSRHAERSPGASRWHQQPCVSARNRTGLRFRCTSPIMIGA